MSGIKVTLSQLPLAPSSRLVTHNLTPDPLTVSPSAFLALQRNSPSLQRRARLLDSSAHFSHVAPLPLPFPFGIDFPEGVENKSEFIEGWLSHREATEKVDTPGAAERGDDIKLSKYTSEARIQERELLGVAMTCLEDCFPNLDVGDAFEVIGTPALLPTPEEIDHSKAKDNKAREEILDILSGHTVLASFPEEKGPNKARRNRGYAPWSLRYSGHQFGSFAGQLGDGRAISLLETPHPTKPSITYEIQLKGAGRTPFSRSADGLAVLRSSIREYLASEAMHALNIPTTRSLSIVYLPTLPVHRERVERASVVTRVAESFIRVGSFEALNPPRQMFMFGGGQQARNLEALRVLGEFVIRKVLRLSRTEGEPWGKELVMECARRNAMMVAGWQAYGFMHGVINTDNISILGLTIDYGPYAFMDVYDEGHICNHSDDEGRYAYRYQPTMIVYALRALLTSLAPLIGAETETGKAVLPGWDANIPNEEILEWANTGMELAGEMQKEIMQVFRIEFLRIMRRRLGLRKADDSDLDKLVDPLLKLMQRHELDFHSTFRKLSSFTPSLLSPNSEPRATFLQELTPETLACRVPSVRQAAMDDWKKWLEAYRTRIESEADEWASEGDVWPEKRRQAMLGANPRFVLRQWVLEEVIKGVEKDWKTGRRVLAKVLEMACRPFRAWGGEGMEEAELGDEDKEERRLCGLGEEAMVGFQCSCSS